MSRRSELLLISCLAAGFLLFLTVCSCEKENLVDPLDIFDTSAPTLWAECDPCGIVAPTPGSNTAPIPGASCSVCTGPNPTSGPTFCIQYTLLVESDVTLTIYTSKGERVINLVRENRPSGTWHCDWDLVNEDGEIVPNGIYRAYFKAGDYITYGDIIITDL